MRKTGERVPNIVGCHRQGGDKRLRYVGVEVMGGRCVLAGGALTVDCEQIKAGML